MLQILLYFIAYLTIAFGIALLIKKNRHSTDILLAVWLFFLSTVYGIGNHINNWEVCLTFTHCVFVYIYVKCLTSHSEFKAKYLVHFIPFVLSIFIAVFFPSIMVKHFIPAYGIMSLFTVIYFAASIKLILDYKKKSKANNSTGRSSNLSWLYLVVFTTIMGHVIKIIPTIFWYANGRVMNDTLINLIILFSLNLVAFKAIRLNLVFFDEAKSNKAKSYSTYNIREDEINLLEQKLMDIMEKEKLYLNHELSLKDISDRLDISSHNLSFLLNTKFNLNFYEFINNYRLEAVKNELINPQKKHFSIFAIASDCGFNSQSTFNRFFKQKVGLSPSQYRDQHININQVS